MNIIKARIQSVYKGKANNTLLQLFRYFFASGFTFLIDFGTLIILTEYFHFNYLISAGTAYLFGLLINYFLSVRWVFNSRSIENQQLEILLFIIIGFVGLGLNQLFLSVLTDILVIYYIFSKIITSFIVYFWNFYARKIILFNK